MTTMLETIEDCGNGYGWSLVRLSSGILEIASLRDGKIIKVEKTPTILDAANIMTQLARN